MRKIKKWMIRVQDNFKLAKVPAIIFIALLIFIDYVSLFNLFASLDISTDFMFQSNNAVFASGSLSFSELSQASSSWPAIFTLSQTTIFSLALAVLLEGNPVLIGIFGSSLVDKTRYNVNDKANAKFGFWISLIGSFATVALMVMLRVFQMESNGGAAAFFGKKNYGGSLENNTQFIAHVCLMILPILTSAFAFAISWVAFRNDSAQKLERKIDKRYRQYLVLQSEFLDTVNRTDDAMFVLWSSLSAHEKMPEKLEDFRKECTDRIRSKLIDNCIRSFPDQVERYNLAVINLLQEFVNDMSARTTSIPRDIQSIDVVRDIVDKHDQNVKNTNPSNAWDYSISGPYLERELKEMLDNAVVVAQYKTVVKPYHLEGDY